MPRRSILTATEHENLLGWPEARAELIRYYGPCFALDSCLIGIIMLCL
jgi:hypothetical protein